MEFPISIQWILLILATTLSLQLPLVPPPHLPPTFMAFIVISNPLNPVISARGTKGKCWIFPFIVQLPLTFLCQIFLSVTIHPHSEQKLQRVPTEVRKEIAPLLPHPGFLEVATLNSLLSDLFCSGKRHERGLRTSWQEGWWDSRERRQERVSRKECSQINYTRVKLSCLSVCDMTRLTHIGFVWKLSPEHG